MDVMNNYWTLRYSGFKYATDNQLVEYNILMYKESDYNVIVITITMINENYKMKAKTTTIKILPIIKDS